MVATHSWALTGAPNRGLILDQLMVVSACRVDEELYSHSRKRKSVISRESPEYPPGTWNKAC